LWSRERLPSRAALSRFLAQVENPACQALHRLLLEDLLGFGLTAPHLGGLLDRRGLRHLFFDVDCTRQVIRQRALPTGPERPAPRRRAARLCARGYTGHKRGEVLRTRTTVQQAHTHEWLGSFGAAGNGDFYGELASACEAIHRYLVVHGLSPAQGVLRLDGLYGKAYVAKDLTRRGLGYVMRTANY